MSTNKPTNKMRYEVITQEDPESGDVILPIPQPVLDELGWKEGTEIEIEIGNSGAIIFKKSTI